jgi:hypothetical protein
MWSLLVTLLPEEAWLLLMVVAGLLVMVGARRWGLRLLGLVVFLALATPFLGGLMAKVLAYLTPTQQYLVMLAGGLLFCLSLVRLLLGRAVYAQVMGHLIYDLLRLPFRLVGWLWRRGQRAL